MHDLLTIRSIPELQDALSQQRAFTRKVLEELDTLGAQLPDEASPEEEIKVAAELKAQEYRLLARYSELPTLTEFQQLPALRGMSNAGGTFGVAAVVGEVLLSTVRGITPGFVRLHRVIMLLLLKEMDDPALADSDLVDPVVRFMRLQMHESLSKLGEEERSKLVHETVRPLVQAMLLVLHEYGVVEIPDANGYRLTPVGKRVFMHLFDVQKFIDAVSAAHIRLQGAPSAPEAK
jgi:hypothetical protein